MMTSIIRFFLWYTTVMIDSLRRVTTAVFFVALVGVIGGASSTFLTCTNASECAASAILSSSNFTSLDNTSELFIISAAIWVVSLYTLGVSVGLLVALEIFKPKLFRRHTRRVHRRR